MTQTHERYNHAKIYKLVGEDPTYFYIGSTCLPLRQRLYLHKSAGKKNPKTPVYNHFNALNWQGVKCVLIEEIKCQNKEQLLRRERHFLDLLNPTLNKRKPWISQEEFMKSNRERQANWYAKNTDKAKEYQANYRAEKKAERLAQNT
jgi:hypothetical protein